jgi:hypothetical protein
MDRGGPMMPWMLFKTMIKNVAMLVHNGRVMNRILKGVQIAPVMIRILTDLSTSRALEFGV